MEVLSLHDILLAWQAVKMDYRRAVDLAQIDIIGELLQGSRAQRCRDMHGTERTRVPAGRGGGRPYSRTSKAQRGMTAIPVDLITPNSVPLFGGK
jgi:hypothetical protein